MHLKVVQFIACIGIILSGCESATAPSDQPAAENIS
jgi:hypothetical protein